MTTTKKVAIGFTGAFGSGCTTAAKHLRDQRQFSLITLSDVIKAKWSEKYGSKQPLRSDLQKFGDDIRRTYGPGVLVDFALSDPVLASSNRFVFDGIRNLGELERLRTIFGFDFTLFAILSQKDSRWDRIGAPAYTDKGLSKKDFDDDDQCDWDEETIHGQQVKLCVDKADILIDNSESLKDFLPKILRYSGLVIGEISEPATQNEIFMNMAFSASHSSKCLKRHVGAVVVDLRGQVVGVGYNENPIGTKPCAEEPSYDFKCYRDILRNGHFDDLAKRGARCPKCGEPLKTKEGPPWICEACSLKGEKTNLEPFFFPDRAMNWCTAVHAELWAIMAAGERARGGTLYTTTFPCFQCTEKLIQAGIEEVYFTDMYPDPHSGKRLELGNVILHQFEGVRSISFERLFEKTRPS
jgi:deoxycytidylate deaminase